MAKKSNGPFELTGLIKDPRVHGYSWRAIFKLRKILRDLPPLSACSPVPYAVTGQPAVTWEGHTLLLSDPDMMIVDDDGLIWYAGDMTEQCQYGLSWGPNKREYAPEGIVLFGQGPSSQKHLIISNADLGYHRDMLMRPATDGVFFLNDCSEVLVLSISLLCLARLRNNGKPNPIDAANELRTGKWEILAYRPDDFMSPIPKELCGLSSYKKTFKTRLAKYTAEGWTMFRDDETRRRYMHRPAMLLMKPGKGNKYPHHVLFGQDEESYFACALPTKKSTTIAQALKELCPKEARGKFVRRQGEWFEVPIPMDKVPSPEQCVVDMPRFDLNPRVSVSPEPSVFLGPYSSSGNRHILTGEKIRIGKDGCVYAFKTNLEHPQHKDLLWVNQPDDVMGWWVKYVKNTAIESFSQDGVD